MIKNVLQRKNRSGKVFVRSKIHTQALFCLRGNKLFDLLIWFIPFQTLPFGWFFDPLKLFFSTIDRSNVWKHFLTAAREKSWGKIRYPLLPILIKRCNLYPKENKMAGPVFHSLIGSSSFENGLFHAEVKSSRSREPRSLECDLWIQGFSGKDIRLPWTVLRPGSPVQPAPSGYGL